MLRMAMRAYCRAYGIDLDDYQVPEGGYTTFDAFFTRQLRPGKRPIDPQVDTVVSPADGRIEDIGPIEPESRLLIKGHSYSVAELLADRWAASLYAGGQFAVVYLSPKDYHRVHAPVEGHVRAVRHVPGSLFPVNAIGLEHIPRLFARNERVVIEQQSPIHGPLTSVMVGAIGVGRISLAFDHELITNDGKAYGERIFLSEEGPMLRRGDELGMFHLGSTVILLAGPGSGLVASARAGQRVQMGEAIWRRSPPRTEVRS
jgi:phosphatidylserine decarboxylase